jgi:hypothetical protein
MRRELAQPRDRDAARAFQLAAHELLEQLRLLAQHARGAQHVGLGRGMHGAQRGQEASAYPRAREALVDIARVLPPGESALAAVGRRLLARERQQGTDQTTIGGHHPEQRPAPRRGGEAVEDRLDLVARRMPGGEETVATLGGLGGGRVAQLARPRLQVAARRLGRALGADHLELHPQPLAQPRAVALVLVGLRAQAVVDVQSAERLGAAHGERDVEQAGRVAPPGDEGDDRLLAREHAARADGFAQLLADHRATPRRRP